VRVAGRQQAMFVLLETLRESETPHVSEHHPSGDDRGSEVDPEELRQQRLSRLRVRAAGDSHVLLLLAPSERGTVRRRDALRLGMSKAEYRAARRLMLEPTRLGRPREARNWMPRAGIVQGTGRVPGTPAIIDRARRAALGGVAGRARDGSPALTSVPT
jgi:hypothetical protein